MWLNPLISWNQLYPVGLKLPRSHKRNTLKFELQTNFGLPFERNLFFQFHKIIKLTGSKIGILIVNSLLLLNKRFPLAPKLALEILAQSWVYITNPIAYKNILFLFLFLLHYFLERGMSAFHAQCVRPHKIGNTPRIQTVPVPSFHHRRFQWKLLLFELG